MLVSELKPGMILTLDEEFRYYFQESSRSTLPRLRTVPDVIAEIVMNKKIDKKQQPVMYLGETQQHISGQSGKSRKLRTVMVDNTVAFVEGREFRRFNPIFSESFSGNI